MQIDYLAICEATTGSDAEDDHKVAEGIRAVIGGEVEEFLYDYPCHSEDGPHWYYMRAMRMSGPGPTRVVASHEEITALKLTEEALRKSQEELIEQKQSLEEANIAMKVLLKQREEDKLDLILDFSEVDEDSFGSFAVMMLLLNWQMFRVIKIFFPKIEHWAVHTRVGNFCS